MTKSADPRAHSNTAAPQKSSQVKPAAIAALSTRPSAVSGRTTPQGELSAPGPDVRPLEIPFSALYVVIFTSDKGFNHYLWRHSW